MSQTDLTTLVNDVNGVIAMLQSSITTFQQVSAGLPALAVQTKALCASSLADAQAQMAAWNALKMAMSDAVNVAEA